MPRPPDSLLTLREKPALASTPGLMPTGLRAGSLRDEREALDTAAGAHRPARRQLEVGEWQARKMVRVLGCAAQLPQSGRLQA